MWCTHSRSGRGAKIARGALLVGLWDHACDCWLEDCWDCWDQEVPRLQLQRASLLQACLTPGSPPAPCCAAGTGKTLLAKAMAGEAGIPFYSGEHPFLL